MNGRERATEIMKSSDVRTTIDWYSALELGFQDPDGYFITFTEPGS